MIAFAPLAALATAALVLIATGTHFAAAPSARLPATPAFPAALAPHAAEAATGAASEGGGGGDGAGVAATVADESAVRSRPPAPAARRWTRPARGGVGINKARTLDPYR